MSRRVSAIFEQSIPFRVRRGLAVAAAGGGASRVCIPFRAGLVGFPWCGVPPVGAGRPAGVWLCGRQVAGGVGVRA